MIELDSYGRDGVSCPELPFRMPSFEQPMLRRRPQGSPPTLSSKPNGSFNNQINHCYYLLTEKSEVEKTPCNLKLNR